MNDWNEVEQEKLSCPAWEDDAVALIRSESAQSITISPPHHDWVESKISACSTRDDRCVSHSSPHLKRVRIGKTVAVQQHHDVILIRKAPVAIFYSRWTTLARRIIPFAGECGKLTYLCYLVPIFHTRCAGLFFVGIILIGTLSTLKQFCQRTNRNIYFPHAPEFWVLIHYEESVWS